MNEDFDSELTEEEIEETLDALTEQILEDEQRTMVLDTHRYEQMSFAYKVLQYLMRDKLDKVSLTYELHKPFKSMGSISLEGESLEFTKAEWFARIAEFASNLNVYPLVKNRVRLTFTFHGLTKPIE